MAIINYTDVQKVRLEIMDGDPVDTSVPRAFSDDQLETFISMKGGIKQAAIYALGLLIMNASKRFNYKQGETTVDFREMVKQMKDRKSELEQELDDESGTGAGGFAMVDLDSDYIREGDEECSIGCDNFERLERRILK